MGWLSCWGLARVAMPVMAALALQAQPVLAAAELTAQDKFDIQFTTPFNFVREVDVLGLDLFEASAARLQELHRRGVRTICYVNAGAREDWRPDARDYPGVVIGRRYAGWPGERWVDIRRLDILRPILEKRLDLCKSKGFAAVELDNVDGYANNTGFPLTAQDQLAFNRWLAEAAKARGLSVGLKNNLEQAGELEGLFDFAIVESCFERNECHLVRPFTDAGKPAFVIEYTNVQRKMDRYCADAANLGVQLIFKTKSLNGKLHRRCP